MQNNNNVKKSLVWEIAKWEFKRWFKLKEHVITIIVGALISLLIFGGSIIFKKFTSKKANVAIVNTTNIPFNLSNESSVNLIQTKTDELEKQKELLNKEEIEGILIIDNYNSVELLVNKEPSWLPEIQPVLNEIHRQIKLKESNIPLEQLNEIFKEVNVKLEFTKIQKEKTTKGEKFTAIVFIALMLVGIIFGLAYQFTAITGEKQLRITEVVVSAISPQTWIDGKIIGISLLSLSMLITYSLTSLSFVVISLIFGSGWDIPMGVINPFFITLLFAFPLSGFFFWNTFFSAIAATINDPNTSARGSLLMLPVLPVVFGFVALSSPDTILMKVLSIFPLTSAPVMAARLVVTDVPVIEVVLSLLFILISTWYLRKAAGRIFAYSILMYGKEPSWKEMFQWVRKH